MNIKFDDSNSDSLSINIEFDKYDPENKSLRQTVFESIKGMVKVQISKINDELYKAKQQEEKLKKEIEIEQKKKDESVK